MSSLQSCRLCPWMLLEAWPPKPLRVRRKRENICFHVVCFGKSILFVWNENNFQVYDERRVVKRGLLSVSYPSFLMALGSVSAQSQSQGWSFGIPLIQCRPPDLSLLLASLWKWLSMEGSIEEHVSQMVFVFLCNFCGNQRILGILRPPLLEISNGDLGTKKSMRCRRHSTLCF